MGIPNEVYDVQTNGYYFKQGRPNSNEQGYSPLVLVRSHLLLVPKFLPTMRGIDRSKFRPQRIAEVANFRASIEELLKEGFDGETKLAIEYPDVNRESMPVITEPIGTLANYRLR